MYTAAFPDSSTVLRDHDGVGLTGTGASTAGVRFPLALDSRDDPSIAYVNARNNTLHYITRNSTGWQDQLVDNTSSLSRPVLRLDRFDNPHIAYTHNTGLYTGEKWYTTLSDGTWEKRMVAEGYTGWYVGLAVSGSGVPALSYVQSREGKPGLYYAPITASGQFVPYLVASAVSVITRPSSMTGCKGHILHISSSTTGLRPSWITPTET